MELTIEQRKAKSLYIQGKSAVEISEELKITKSTVYRWISNEKLGFKDSKKIASFNSGDMAGIIDESHKKLLIEISENPDKLLDPKTADALLKVSKVLESLGQRKKEEDAEEQKEEEIKGVLIIDDITYENLKKTENKTIKNNES